jgi:hypothetical protein
MRPRFLKLLPVVAVAALPASAAVVVSFPNPPHQYTDVGTPGAETDQTFSTIAQHLQRLGARYLPKSQSLRVEVLDVDLAGDLRRGAMREVRVVRGTSDFPRVTLRYTLEEGGRTLQSREETISDSSYLWFPGKVRESESLYHEKQLLERWFKDRFFK